MINVLYKNLFQQIDNVFSVLKTNILIMKNKIVQFAAMENYLILIYINALNHKLTIKPIRK